MSYKISVIVPCYNAEDTLVRCIESLINQSLGFENIELLLYDDASKDGTREIILDYSNKYDNIIPILADTNTGQGIGRNKCMEIASSDYFMFLDSDDEFTEKMCEVLLNEMLDSGADLVTCSYLNHHDSETNEAFNKYHGGTVEGDKIIFEDNEVFNLINWVVWLCIFKKSIIDEYNLSFSSNAGEDMHFIFQYLVHINKSIYLKNFFGVFRYTQEDSISYSYTLTDLDEFLELTVDSINIFINEGIDYSFIFRPNIIFMIYQLYVSNGNILNDKEGTISFLRKLNSFEKKYKFNYNYPILIRIVNDLILHEKYNLAYIYLYIYEKIYKNDFIRHAYNKIMK